MATDLGEPDLAALALAGAARVTLNTDPSRSVERTREAMTITADVPDGPGRSSAEHVLGVALQLAGDLEGAREVIGARLANARTAGNEYVAFIESANLSMVERKLGNLERAEALSRDALGYTAREHDVMATAWTLNGLAAVTAAQGHHVRAATLIGSAEALLGAAGGEWPADEREQFDSTLATLHDAMAPAEFDAARRSGAAMTFERAVAFALSSELSPGRAPGQAATGAEARRPPSGRTR